MRLSLFVTHFPWSGVEFGRELTRIAQQAEAGGLDTLWLPDRLIHTKPTDPLLEGWTTLGYLAAVTDRIRLGTAVTAVGLRQPALLIKAVTTLDVLSGGRAWLGIGSGNLFDEAEVMGLPWAPASDRLDELEDTVRLALQMWSGDETAFRGTCVSLTRPVHSPQPTTRPHPPILIGGAGERRTLRLVAQYAQACNLHDARDGGATIRHKLDVLAKHCADVERDPAEIEKTVVTGLDDGDRPEDFVARCRELAYAGIEHALVSTDGPWTDDALARLTEAATALRDPVHA